MAFFKVDPSLVTEEVKPEIKLTEKLKFITDLSGKGRLVKVFIGPDYEFFEDIYY